MESLMAIKLKGLKAVLAVKQVNDALEKHPHPEIFNTDQGAQCTSEIHTQRLKKLGIIPIYAKVS
jgi:ABC-type proline/glycine betaine transport system substrate-binding protein